MGQQQQRLPLALLVFYACRLPPRRRRRPRRDASEPETRSRYTQKPLCIISVPGQASGRTALVGIRRILLPEPLQIEPLPEAIPVPALPLPRAEAAQVRGLPQEVRAEDQALPARHQAAQVRAQRRRLRVQVRGVVPLQRARQPHAHHSLHLPLRSAHRPCAPHPRRAGAGGPLLRAVPGQLVGAPGGLPGEQPPQAPHWRAGELRQHAQERRRPQRRPPQRAGVVAAALRLPPRRAVPAEALRQRLLRRGPGNAEQVHLDDPQVRQLLRAGAVPDAHVRGGARENVPAEGGRVPSPGTVPLPSDEQGLGDHQKILRSVPCQSGREDRVPDQDLPGEADQVREHVRPADEVHQGAAAVAGARHRRAAGEHDVRRGREGEGRPDRVPVLGVLREDPGHVLREPHQDGGDRGGVPAEPRGAAAVHVERAQPEGAGGDLPAELLRQDRDERVVHLRVRRLQFRRREAVDPAPAGLEQGDLRGGVRPVPVRGAVPALAAPARVQGQEGRRRGRRQAVRPAL